MRLRSVILLSLGVATFPVQSLGAAPMGATSRAVLHVTVSVRPRIGVSTVSGGQPGQGLCLWSTLGNKKFFISLSGSSERKAPIEIVARSTLLDCSAHPAHLTLGESTLYMKGSQLLLIAPE